jgi:hypothetical protein
VGRQPWEISPVTTRVFFETTCEGNIASVTCFIEPNAIV